jgi:hypothetical protein
VFCTKDSRSFLQEIRDSCDFACARLSVFSPTTFEIWSEKERYDRHSFAMACSAPSIGLLLSPSIGVGGRTLASSSSLQSTSAFTPSSQQQHYNISSCFLTTSNKLRLSTVEGFQQGSRLRLKKSSQQTVHVRCEVGTGTVSTSSGTEWVQRTIELPVYKRGCHIITRDIYRAVPELAQFRVGIAHLFGE